MKYNFVLPTYITFYNKYPDNINETYYYSEINTNRYTINII